MGFIRRITRNPQEEKEIRRLLRPIPPDELKDFFKRNRGGTDRGETKPELINKFVGDEDVSTVKRFVKAYEKRRLLKSIPFLKKPKPKGRDINRNFRRTQKSAILHQQNMKCAICKKKLDPRAIRYDHKKPWADEGRTIVDNGRAVHPNCHAIRHHEKTLEKLEN